MIEQLTNSSAETLRVRVTTIYALSMPKYVYVQMYGREGAQPPPPIKIKADTFEEEGGWYQIKLANQVIGKFNSGSVAGWWIQDEEHQKATF